MSLIYHTIFIYLLTEVSIEILLYLFEYSIQYLQQIQYSTYSQVVLYMYRYIMYYLYVILCSSIEYFIYLHSCYYLFIISF